MGYLVSNGRNGRVEYSGTQYVNLPGGTKKLCVRTGTGPNDVIRYGLTTRSSASAYCGLRMRIEGGVAYIGRRETRSASGVEVRTESTSMTISTSVSSTSSSKYSVTHAYSTTKQSNYVASETVRETLTETYVTTSLRTSSTSSSSLSKTTGRYTTSQSKLATVSTSSHTFTVSNGSSSYSTIRTSTMSSLWTASKTGGYASSSGMEAGSGISGLVGKVTSTRLAGTNTFSTLSRYTYSYYTTHKETIRRAGSTQRTLAQTLSRTWGWTSSHSMECFSKGNQSTSMRYSYTIERQTSKLSTKLSSVQVNTTSQSIGESTASFVTSASSTMNSSSSRTVERTTSSSYVEDNFDL